VPKLFLLSGSEAEKVIEFARRAAQYDVLSMAPAMDHVTGLLIQWSNGDKAALDKLMPLVHEELRRLAHRYMRREREGHTLQTTALVNEAYLRMVNRKQVKWQNRAHFFAVAAQVMRTILVDYARSHAYAKRGGGAHRLTFDEAMVVSPDRSAEVVAIDEALKQLALIDPQQSQIVELRFFGGLTIEETAEVLHVSPATIKREWSTAKAWLYHELNETDLSNDSRTMATD
jgi:RNA polymerase sigma factor (TIGR02999 family)